MTFECVADKFIWWREAEAVCAPVIESLAEWSARWTDGFLENKLETVMLMPPDYEQLKFQGSKVEFQNGLGAWRRMNYLCTYNPIDKVITDVGVW